MNNSLLLKRSQVLAITSLSRTSLWELEAAGNFPKAIRISPNGRSVRYRTDEVMEWLNNLN